MTTQVTVKNLSPVTYNQIPVITTELLARLYGTEAIRIQQNHHENKSRFIEPPRKSWRLNSLRKR